MGQQRRRAINVTLERGTFYNGDRTGLTLGSELFVVYNK